MMMLNKMNQLKFQQVILYGNEQIVIVLPLMVKMYYILMMINNGKQQLYLKINLVICMQYVHVATIY